MGSENQICLSVVIITKNEEGRLSDCLASVAEADELIVIDSGSTDRTLEIAERFNCKIFQELWKGYGLQKQSGIDKSSNQWVLVVDADERIPSETWSTIKNSLAEFGDKADAFNFPRKSFFDGKWLRHGYEWPDRVTRLLNKNRARMDGSIVHENVIADKVIYLHSPILHLRKFAMTDYLHKINSYSTLLAEKTFSSNPNKKTSVTRAAFSSLAHFGRAYILKMGVLDGRGGFIIAFTEALHSFFKHIKILELQGKIKNS